MWFSEFVQPKKSTEPAARCLQKFFSRFGCLSSCVVVQVVGLTSEVMRHVCRWITVTPDHGVMNHAHRQGAAQRCGWCLRDVLVAELCEAVIIYPEPFHPDGIATRHPLPAAERFNRA